MARGISNRKIDVAMQLVAALNTRSPDRVCELITSDCRFYFFDDSEIVG